MSEKPFAIRIRTGEYEVELSGSKDEVLAVLERLDETISKVSNAFKKTTSSMNPPSEEKPPYPSITPQKSCGETILQLLSTEWGRESPRTLREIMDALAANAIHYPMSTVGKALQRLVLRNKLRRWETKRGYVYVLA